MASTVRNNVDPAIQEKWWSDPAWQQLMGRVQQLTAAGIPQSQAMIRARREVPNAPQPPAGYQVDDYGNLTAARDNGANLGSFFATGGAMLGAAAGAAALPSLFASGAGAAAGGGAAAGSGAAAGGTAAATGAAAAGASIPGWLPPVLSTGAKLLNSAVEARQGARENQAGYNNQFDQLQQRNTQLGQVNVNLDLDQRRYLDDHFKQKTNEAVRGGFLQGAQDAHVNRPSTIPGGNLTGGLRPSAITGRQEIGSALQRQAMLELMNPTQQTGTTPGRLPAVPNVPELSRVSGPGRLDTGLSIAGFGAQAGSYIQDLLASNRKLLPVPSPPAGDPYYDQFRSNNLRF